MHAYGCCLFPLTLAIPYSDVPMSLQVEMTYVLSLILSALVADSTNWSQHTFSINWQLCVEFLFRSAPGSHWWSVNVSMWEQTSLVSLAVYIDSQRSRFRSLHYLFAKSFLSQGFFDCTWNFLWYSNLSLCSVKANQFFLIFYFKRRVLVFLLLSSSNFTFCMPYFYSRAVNVLILSFC